MYYVLIGDISGNNEVLYYPSDEDYAIYDTELNQTVGEIGEFNFKVPVQNDFYDLVAEHKIITIVRNNKEYWRGFIKEITTDEYKNLSVYCVEDLAWLAYEFSPPEYTETTKLQQFQKIINTYNSQNGIAGTEKVFEIGFITFNGLSQWVYETNYDTSLLEGLKLVAEDDYYVRVRRQNGKRYIDIVGLNDYGKASTQPIQFANNLLSYVKEMNTAYMLNVIYPYGAELNGSEVYEGLTKKLAGNPLANTASIAKYGRIAKTVTFDDCIELDELNRLAGKYLDMNSKPLITLELTAVDMSDFSDINSDDIAIGDKVEIIAPPYGFMGNDWITVVELKTNLQDLSQSVFTLSTTLQGRKTLTDIQNGMEVAVRKIPSQSAILEAAKKNAKEMLEGVQGGYVTYIFNEDGQIEQMWIADNLEKEKITKKWVWSMGGLGYMFKDEEGNWKTNIAMTMDGSLVADFITTGQLVLAGASNDPDSGAYLSVYDGDTLIGEWGKNGISVHKGEIDLGHGVFHVDNKGNMTANSATITSGLIKSVDTKNYINFKPEGSYSNYMLFNGICKVRMDSAGRFGFSRAYINDSANSEQYPQVLLERSGVSYKKNNIEGSKASWEDIIAAANN